MGSNPRPYHGRLDRFANEIGTTGLQGGSLFFRAGQGGDKDDGGVCRGGLLLELLAQRQSIHFGHDDVQQDQIGQGRALTQFQRLGGAGGGKDLVVLLKNLVQRLDVDRLFVHHQQARAAQLVLVVEGGAG